MAVGSSAPEISVNILDTIFGEAVTCKQLTQKNQDVFKDLGLDSVIGSSLFNVLFRFFYGALSNVYTQFSVQFCLWLNGVFLKWPNTSTTFFCLWAKNRKKSINSFQTINPSTILKDSVSLRRIRCSNLTLSRQKCAQIG